MQDRVARRDLPTLPPGAVAALRAMGCSTSAVADALDALGLAGVVGATALRGSISGAVMAGRALTVRNIARREAPATLAHDGENRMGEAEAHRIAQPGDIIVIQGVAGCSNMGGVAARMGQHRGEAGAVIAGGVRDIGESRAAGYPIWASELTPLTGKWRLETVEINGPVEICGIQVEPGDLVVADECGVCFVPHAHVAEVVAFATRKHAAEQAMVAKVDAGAAG